MDINKEFKKISNSKIDIEYIEEDKVVIISYKEPEKFTIQISRIIEEDQLFLESIRKNYIESHYINGTSFYKDNYYEQIITPLHIITYHPEELIYIPAQGFIDQNSSLYYEISQVSDPFKNFLNATICSRYFEPDYYESIKIYNINKALAIETEDKAYLSKCTEIIDSVFFDLYHKHDLLMTRVDHKHFEDDDYYHQSKAEYNPDVEKTSVTPSMYDPDLVSYYNRAAQMEDSEFKYLAYFQVLECIFDEVYLHETILDVKGILQSNWFSIQNDSHIKDLIEIVERYNKQKNDRNKTKTVLDKYFKGDLHDEAYILANKEILASLKKIGVIKKDEEFKDIQRLANVIYDFRCKCTHSNRSFPVKNSTVISSASLSDYILLIKKISEKIILNYRKK